MKVTISMKLVKETKNTFRYEAAAPAPGEAKPPVDCVYLQKNAVAPLVAPQSVTVTVEG